MDIILYAAGPPSAVQHTAQWYAGSCGRVRGIGPTSLVFCQKFGSISSDNRLFCQSSPYRVGYLLFGEFSTKKKKLSKNIHKSLRSMRGTPFFAFKKQNSTIYSSTTTAHRTCQSTSPAEAYPVRAHHPPNNMRPHCEQEYGTRAAYTTRDCYASGPQKLLQPRHVTEKNPLGLRPKRAESQALRIKYLVQ